MLRAVALILALTVTAYSDGVQAQTGVDKRPISRQPALPSDALYVGRNKSDANAGTVSIMTQRMPSGPLTTAALDLSTLLDDGDRYEKMRVVPVISRGQMQNLWDMLYLDGVDLAFLQTDTLEYLRDTPQVASIKEKVRYVTAMFSEELYVVARSDISSLKDLAGKKVSIGTRGAASAVTAPIIFKRLGIAAILENEDTGIAIERLRAGDLAAHVFLLPRPARPVAELRGDGLRLLPVPLTSGLEQLYQPAKFSSAEYPNLIPAGQQVESVAVSAILAVFNWPKGSERYKKVTRFVEAFFTRFSELQKPGFLAKWREVDLTAQVPGWTRFKPAQEWLDKQGGRDKNADDRFEAFAREQGTGRGDEREDELFQKFLQWMKARSLPRPSTELAVSERAPTPQSAETAATTVQKPKIRLLIAGRAPLTDQDRPDGGLVTALVSSSLGRVAGGDARQSGIDMRWAVAGLPQIPSLLGDDSIDLSLPWGSANCERPDDLAPASVALCENAIYSDPIVQLIVGLFTLSDSAFKFDTDESVVGKTICLPQDRDLSALSGIGRNWISEKRIVAVRLPTLVDCINAVRRHEADAFIASDLEGRYELTKQGLRPLFRMAERPVGMLGVHAIVSRKNPQAATLIDALNRGLTQLKQSDAYSTIVNQHLMQLWQSPAGTP